MSYKLLKNVCCVVLIIPFLAFSQSLDGLAAPLGDSMKISKIESCYEQGVRYGRCAYSSIKGRKCKPVDDIAISVACRGSEETKKGITAGMVEVEKMIPVPLNAFEKGNWYDGGNLHKANVSAWKLASDKNKIATAADWVLTISAIKDVVQESGNIDTAKKFAKELVTCINTALDGFAVSVSVSEIAVLCTLKMGWYK